MSTISFDESKKNSKKSKKKEKDFLDTILEQMPGEELATGDEYDFEDYDEFEDDEYGPDDTMIMAAMFEGYNHLVYNELSEIMELMDGEEKDLKKARKKIAKLLKVVEKFTAPYEFEE